MADLTDTFIFSKESQEVTDKLLTLTAEWNDRCSVLRASNLHTEAVYEALDLDLINVLAQVLPYLISLFTGGFAVETILSILKMIVPLIVKDAQLQAILIQVIQTILSLLVK